MDTMKGVIAVAIGCLAATSPNALAAGTFRCPELPANSGTHWVSLDPFIIPMLPMPNWCDAVDTQSGRMLFALHFNNGSHALQPHPSRAGSAGVVAGRRVRWITSLGSAYEVDSGWFPYRYTTVPLRNGGFMQITVTAPRAHMQKALSVLAQMHLPNHD